MTDPTPWLVIKCGHDVPAGVMRLACLRCGDMHDMSLPIPVSALTTIDADFRKRHRNCKERP